MQPKDLGAAGEMLRRVAFVDRDVRLAVTDDGPIAGVMAESDKPLAAVPV